MVFWSCKRIVPPQVKTYLIANAGTPDEAASDPGSVQDGAPVIIPDHLTSDEIARRAPNAGREDEAGQPVRPGLPAQSDAAQQADSSRNTAMSETPAMPSATIRGDDTPREESNRALKAPRLDAPGQQTMLMLVSQNVMQSVCQVLSLDHEDEPNPTHFEQGELDDLEDYDVCLELEENDALNADFEESEMSDSVDRLCMPYTSQEPDVPADELAKLDALADQVEISRLKGLGVLLPVSTLPEGEVKRLTACFVRTWHGKNINNERRWLRRSRYVAREFSWLSPDRQDLCSPHPATSPTDCFSMHFYIGRVMTLCKVWPLLILVILSSLLSKYNQQLYLVNWLQV